MKNLIERLELSEGKLKRSQLKSAAINAFNVGKRARGAVADGSLEVAFNDLGVLIASLSEYLSSASQDRSIAMKGQMVLDAVRRAAEGIRAKSKFAEVDAMAEGRVFMRPSGDVDYEDRQLGESVDGNLVREITIALKAMKQNRTVDLDNLDYRSLLKSVHDDMIDSSWSGKTERSFDASFKKAFTKIFGKRDKQLGESTGATLATFSKRLLTTSRDMEGIYDWIADFQQDGIEVPPKVAARLAKIKNDVFRLADQIDSSGNDLRRIR